MAWAARVGLARRDQEAKRRGTDFPMRRGVGVWGRATISPQVAASAESCGWLYTEVDATPSSTATPPALPGGRFAAPPSPRLLPCVTLHPLPSSVPGSGGVGRSAALTLLEREPTRTLRRAALQLTPRRPERDPCHLTPAS